MRVYTIRTSYTPPPCKIVTISVEKQQMTPVDITPVSANLLDFCVLGVRKEECKSPVELPENLYRLVSTIMPIFISLNDQDIHILEKEWTEIMTLLEHVSFFHWIIIDTYRPLCEAFCIL